MPWTEGCLCVLATIAAIQRFVTKAGRPPMCKGQGSSTKTKTTQPKNRRKMQASKLLHYCHYCSLEVTTYRCSYLLLGIARFGLGLVLVVLSDLSGKSGAQEQGEELEAQNSLAIGPEDI